MAEPDVLDVQLAGLDRLESAAGPRASNRLARAWRATWPKLLAIAIALVFWQLVVASGWRSTTVLPPPGRVFAKLWDEAQTEKFWTAIYNTMRRAAVGYAIAIVIGTVVGSAVAGFRVLRSAIGSMITGLQTMPSIAWFPAAIGLFGLRESAITFVIIIGAAPSIANGIVSGIDQVPPVLVRAGRVLGARGLSLYRKVVLPAALPNAVTGLKQGWAFAWRSLMAGELLVIIASKPSIGVNLAISRDFVDYPRMYSVMVVIFVIGVVIDAVLFAGIERAVLRRRGLGATGI
jgi:NitT/TauT family transport system permease protein